MTKKTFRDRLRELDFATLFMLGVAASAVLYALVAIFSQNYSFKDIFFASTEDAFMDFFNSVRDAHLGLGAYTERHVIYPPLANLFYQLISLITPDEYNATSFDERLSWQSFTENKIIITVYLTICIIAVAIAVRRAIRLRGAKGALITLAICISVPHIFLVERGNIISLAFVLVLIFVMTYDSESAVWREIGLLALALSFSIKLYTALFAWLLIGDRRFREFLRCIAYSLALLVLPSLAYGPHSLIVLLQNIFGFSTGEASAPEKISAFLLEKYSVSLPAALFSTLMFGGFAILALNFAVSPFIWREKWKVWKDACLAFISFPALTRVYNWLFFAIPLILLFLESPRVKGKRTVYFVLMSLPFLYIPLRLGNIPLTANTALVFITVPILGAISVIDTLLFFCKKEKLPTKTPEPTEIYQ